MTSNTKFPTNYFDLYNEVYHTEIITSSGTVTKPLRHIPANATVFIYGLAGGGGGGRSYNDGSGYTAVGGAGGTGFLFSVPYSMFSEVTFTLGDGGAGRTSSEGTGSPGGDTTISLTCDSTEYGTDLPLTFVLEGGAGGDAARNPGPFTFNGGNSVIATIGDTPGYGTMTTIQLTGVEYKGADSTSGNTGSVFESVIYGGTAGGSGYSAAAITSLVSMAGQVNHFVAGLLGSTSQAVGGASKFMDAGNEGLIAGTGGYGCGGGSIVRANNSLAGSGGDGGPGIGAIIITSRHQRAKYHFPFGIF